MFCACSQEQASRSSLSRDFKRAWWRGTDIVFRRHEGWACSNLCLRQQYAEADGFARKKAQRSQSQVDSEIDTQNIKPTRPDCKPPLLIQNHEHCLPNRMVQHHMQDHEGVSLSLLWAGEDPHVLHISFQCTDRNMHPRILVTCS